MNNACTTPRGGQSATCARPVMSKRKSAEDKRPARRSARFLPDSSSSCAPEHTEAESSSSNECILVSVLLICTERSGSCFSRHQHGHLPFQIEADSGPTPKGGASSSTSADQGTDLSEVGIVKCGSRHCFLWGRVASRAELILRPFSPRAVDAVPTVNGFAAYHSSFDITSSQATPKSSFGTARQAFCKEPSGRTSAAFDSWRGRTSKTASIPSQR